MGAADFRKLCSNLLVDNRGEITARRHAITRRLNADFWDSTSETAHSRFVGSFGRNTAIRDFHDLDLLFLLPANLYARYSGYATNGQSALLQAVRASIKKRYAATDVGGDGQVVVVRFAEGMRFEVLPTFKQKDGSFLHPDSNKSGVWRVTNPLPEIAAVGEADRLYNGNLRSLCRMARAWRRKWDVPMGGLLVDTLALSFLRSWPQRTEGYAAYGDMSRDFFVHLAGQSAKQAYWCAPGSGQRIGKKGAFRLKAKQCHALAEAALAHEAKGRPNAAANKWKEIYGSFYP